MSIVAADDKFDENKVYEESESFDAMKLFDAFTKCLIKSDVNSLSSYDDVSLHSYLIAYNEINKFLGRMGTVFYFVTSDISEKIKTIEIYLKESPEHYQTIQSLINYENGKKMLIKPASSTRKNASRHILRLHRALQFIYKFLERLYGADTNSKTASICIDVYDATLAKYHPWVIQRLAKVGMYTLPRRESLIDMMIKNAEREDTIKFQQFLKTLETIYTITQSLYQKYAILDLP